MSDSNIQDPVIARQTPRDDFSIDQCWNEYTADEHAIWDLLYARQLEILENRAAPEFLDGLKRLELSRTGIPNLERLNPALKALTDWEIIMVPHLIICKNPTSFTIFLGTFQCSLIRFSQIICKLMVRAVCAR